MSTDDYLTMDDSSNRSHFGVAAKSSHFQAKIRSHTRLYFTVALIKNTECKWNLWIRRCNTFQTRSLTTKMMTFWNNMWASAKNWRESVEAAEWLSLQITTFTEGPKQGRDTSDATLETLQNQFWRWDLMPKDAKVTWWIVFFWQNICYTTEFTIPSFMRFHHVLFWEFPCPAWAVASCRSGHQAGGSP